jgi:hypothetical protein
MPQILPAIAPPQNNVPSIKPAVCDGAGQCAYRLALSPHHSLTHNPPMLESPSIPPIRLEFILTYDEAAAAVRKPFWKSAFSLLVSLTFLGFLFFGKSGLLTELFHPNSFADPIFWFECSVALLGVLLIVGLTAWYQFSQRAAARKKWQREHGDEIQKVTLSADGLGWENTTSRVETKWSIFKRFKENPAVFVLYQETHAVPLPKRIMTPDQINQIRTLLQSHIGTTHAFPVLPPT